MRFIPVWLLATSLLPGFARCARAHEIPNDVVAHIYVKPEREIVRMLVRVPLSAMRDIDFAETSQGYLDIEKLTPQLPNAATIWIAQFVAIYQGGQRLPMPRVAAMQLSLPSDRSFTSFDEALRHVTGPKLGTEANLSWGQVLFDVLLEFPAAGDVAALRVHSRLSQLAARVVTVLRFVQPGGTVRVIEFTGDPGSISLTPSWYESAWQFVKLGFVHIFDGADHLLFLLCLAIPTRRPKVLLVVVTAFTVAHSFTLIASALGLAPDALWFPPLVETLIAASIVYIAIENIAGVSGTVHRRWILAFAFGLVHGFGFSFALRDTLQFAGSNLLVSLLSFNIGVELGQILVLLITASLLSLLFRYVFAERIGVILLSAFVAHTGWHWFLDRGEQFLQFRFEWPSLMQLATTMRWLVFILVIGGAFRLAVGWWQQRGTANEAS